MAETKDCNNVVTSHNIKLRVHQLKLDYDLQSKDHYLHWGLNLQSLLRLWFTKSLFSFKLSAQTNARTKNVYLSLKRHDVPHTG